MRPVNSRFIAGIVCSGNSLTLSVSLTFLNSFAGTKCIFEDVLDLEGPTSGWQARGTWTIP